MELGEKELNKKQLKRKKYKEKLKQKKLLAKTQEKITANIEKFADAHVEESVKIACEMWTRMEAMIENEQTYAQGESFSQLTDDEKIKLLTDEKKYDDFYKEYPIVGRYMVCMGRFDKGAFIKFLHKVRITSKNVPKNRPSGYVEDQWIHRQADYVRYLWEASQKRAKKRIDTKESRAIWRQAYEAIKSEFTDFRADHAEADRVLAEKKEKFDVERFEELKDRLVSGAQTLDDESLNELTEMLRDAVYKKRYEDVLAELTELTPRSQS